MASRKGRKEAQRPSLCYAVLLGTPCPRADQLYANDPSSRRSSTLVPTFAGLRPLSHRLLEAADIRT